MSHAVCIDYPASWWFPEDGDPDPFQLGQVRNVCLGCPVRRECLDFGMANDKREPRGTYGIYAGLTEGERSSLRRTTCVGCRRNEDPALLWGRASNWRPTGCGACDALRTGHRSYRAHRQREETGATPPPPEVLEAEAEWWSRQRAALNR